MFTNPWLDAIMIVDDFFGCARMNDGRSANGTGGSGRRVRVSNTLTDVSACGRDCLQAWHQYPNRDKRQVEK
jgi:hypothetical protein